MLSYFKFNRGFTAVRCNFLRVQSKSECEERTRKKADKRKRKKQAVKAAISNGAKKNKIAADGTATAGGGKGKGKGRGRGEGAADEEEEFVYIPEADLAAAGGDGGSGFKNDGSFLEMMKRELEKSGTRDEPSASASVGGKAIAAK